MEVVARRAARYRRNQKHGRVNFSSSSSFVFYWSSGARRWHSMTQHGTASKLAIPVFHPYSKKIVGLSGADEFVPRS
jgi:hypothetical protein